MPDYKDKLNYSAQKAIFENIDWNTLQFDDRRLRSPLTAEEEKQEESYEPWRDRYWSEVDRKYNKWKVDTGSDFLNAIANGVSRFVSGLTSPLTMKDDDVNYKDEVEFKVNYHNSPIGNTYDIYKTTIYQYKDFIDELSEEFIKTGYYNFDISDNGKNVDFDDDTYEDISNKITNKIISGILFQHEKSSISTNYDKFSTKDNIPDATLYNYGEINDKIKTELKQNIQGKIKYYLKSGYKSLAEKMYSNNVIRSNTMIENEYWFVDKEAEYIANHFNLNADMFDIRFIDPDTGKQINMTYSDFVEEYGVLKKEDIFAFNYPRGELRSYAVRFGENQNILADVSLKTDLDVDQIYQQLRMLNELTISGRKDLFYKDGTPTCEMSQLLADEGYNLLTYYLTSGFMEYTH